jgi:pyruvate carboxylase
MPLAAPARPARGHAQPDDADAAARRSNGVGYTNYPDNVVRFVVKQAAETGVDVFRVFDSLNWVENMRVAMDAVVEATARSARAPICYTGDILTPPREV